VDTLTVRAMNGDVELLSPRSEARHRFGLAASWLRGFERRFSRFDPSSELSGLNARAGRPVAVSQAMLHLVELSLALARRSGGLFDPTILRSLEAAGYDRSFELIEAATLAPPQAPRAASWRDVSVDPAARTITLPPDVGIDLGGIGKGFAADRLAHLLGSPCLVNAGGDLYAAGEPQPGCPWLIGVADPFDAERDIAVLAVSDRGVATSSTRGRRWPCGGSLAHHLIDPRRSAPAESDAIQVTVIAPTAVEAEYHAKVALLLGARQGRDYLDAEDGVDGIVVDEAGSMFMTSGLQRYLRLAEPAVK
jgi:thiamine biosynthesis lipoprotein